LLTGPRRATNRFGGSGPARAVLAVECVVRIGYMADGRVRMLLGDGLDGGTGLVAQTNPSRGPKAMRDGRIQ
jgi:hypothetical protein